MRTSPTSPVVILAVVALLATTAEATPRRVLFDATHAETAGNADWIIDTDQPLPLPSQSTVIASTPRTYWLGAISSWGIDLVKRGDEVATLTAAFGITHGNPANPYDLSKFDVFVVPEPNQAFTAAESTAIFHYVAEGGGLVAVADHIGSDRDGDGIDSPQVWNRLDAQHRWGASFDVTGPNSNFTEVWSTNVSTNPADSTIFGPEGPVNGLEYHNGGAMTLYPAANASVRGCVWRNGQPQGNTAVMAAHAVYGNGRVFYVGDSSVIDDGSAQPGNSSIFDGWAEAAGGDSLLMLNATAWVARRVATVDVGGAAPPATRGSTPNPFRDQARMALDLVRAARLSIEVFDGGGRRVRALAAGPFASGPHEIVWDGKSDAGARVPVGLYFVRARGAGVAREWRLVRVR